MLATDMTASGTPEEKLRQDFHLIFRKRYETLEYNFTLGSQNYT